MARSRSPTPQKIRAQHGSGAAIYLALTGVATAVAFLPALRNGFVNYDDDRLVLHNPHLAQPLLDRLGWMWSTTFLGHYQPLTWLSLSLDYALGGLTPFAYHLDSLCWHVAAAMLLYGLLVDLLKRSGALTPADAPWVAICAAVGALFWSIHPLRVESVAWVAERRDVVSVVFLLLAARAYLRAVDNGLAPLRSIRWFVASCTCLLLSLLAKAWGMSFFVTLIALDVMPLSRLPLGREAFTDRRYRPVWIQKIPYALLGVAAGALAWFAQRREPDTMVAVADWTWSARVLQAAYGLCFYVRKTIWPAHLAVMYGRPNPIDGWPAVFPVSLGLVAAAVVVIVWQARRHAAVAMAALAYAATVAPVLGFAQSGPQLVADRYAYVSSLPFSALLAAALFALPRQRRSVGRAVAAGCLAALAIATWTGTTVWHDSERLWAHALSVGESSYTAHMDYGQTLRASGRTDEAIVHYRIAAELQPSSGNAWYNLANALKAKGQLDDAERGYRTAIEHLDWKVGARVNLGNLYFGRGQLAPAIEQYRAATAELAHARPDEFTPEPFLYLGIALADSGDRPAARDALRVAATYPATRSRALAELARIPR
ncbi:MAG TPA: tetratricopeptide repeat protein [Vicinamibacterales bacterium]|nr:tetratricopeptide repeat protein [Vicinamibacterales bacterium]